MKIDISEALRYLGVRGEAPDELRLGAAEAAMRLEKAVSPRSVWRLCPLRREGDALIAEGTGLVLSGKTARLMLESCDAVALMACTLGAGFDALMRTEQARDISRAVLLDACANACIESVCDAVEREIAAARPGLYLTDRFSPGYGDLPLEIQPTLCQALDAPRRIGLTVTESRLLNPVKSVTALVGLSKSPQKARVRGCAFCAMKENCALRKGGKNCASES